MHYHAFSYAIATEDWLKQEAALAPSNTLSAYFRKHYNPLRSIDLSKVEMILVAYGTNNFTYFKDDFQFK